MQKINSFYRTVSNSMAKIALKTFTNSHKTWDFLWLYDRSKIVTEANVL